MAKFKNVSPLGALDIDALGIRGVEPGEEFDVPDDIALSFYGQPETFEPVDVPASAVEAWEAYSATEGAPTEAVADEPAGAESAKSTKAQKGEVGK